VRILLVEDERNAARFIAKGLREAAHAVDVVGDGLTAAAYVHENDYDAIVLDVMLPGRDGLSVCRELRASGSDVPVIMLTARDSVEARVEGLDAGADDYLAKPFDFRELLARLRALNRRERQPAGVQHVEVSGITIDLRGRHVFRRGTEILLTSREFALLAYLAERPGQVISRAEIVARVWENDDRFSNVVDVYVQRLRRKLDEPDATSLIQTHRGRGYQLGVGQ
jgi:two-component system copper resistance phosphate regulon response regulator CusR